MNPCPIYVAKEVPLGETVYECLSSNDIYMFLVLL